MYLETLEEKTTMKTHRVVETNSEFQSCIGSQ